MNPFRLHVYHEQGHRFTEWLICEQIHAQTTELRWMCVPVISSGTCDNQRIQTYMCLPVLTCGVGKSKRPFRFSCGFANQGVCRRTAHLFSKGHSSRTFFDGATP